METAYYLDDDYARRVELVRLSQRLKGVARDLRGLSAEQPGYSERLRGFQVELQDVARRLRRERA